MSHPPTQTQFAIHAWHRLVCDRKPWNAMTADDRDGAVRAIFDALFEFVADAQCESRVADGRFVAASDRHLAFRAAQRYTRDEVLRDFLLMRVAVRQMLHQQPDAVEDPAKLLRDFQMLSAGVLAAAREPGASGPAASH